MQGPDAPLQPFKLPKAPPLTEQEVFNYGESAVGRLFALISSLEEEGSRSKAPKGFNRLAASEMDRDAWVTIVARLATRSVAGCEDDDTIKLEHGSSRNSRLGLPAIVRESFHRYIMYDWRKRIDVATIWLTEEWFADREHPLAKKDATSSKTHAVDGSTLHGSPPQHYKKWVLRLLDGILPFVEGTDKAIIRFMSEIPQIDDEILARVKRLADDPDRVNLTVMVLQYLCMFRPPARDLCVEVLAELWQNSTYHFLCQRDLHTDRVPRRRTCQTAGAKAPSKVEARGVAKAEAS